MRGCVHWFSKNHSMTKENITSSSLQHAHNHIESTPHWGLDAWSRSPLQRLCIIKLATSSFDSTMVHRLHIDLELEWINNIKALPCLSHLQYLLLAHSFCLPQAPICYPRRPPLKLLLSWPCIEGELNHKNQHFYGASMAMASFNYICARGLTTLVL